MKASKIPTFSERLGASMTAKKAALERFRARPGPDDPATVEQRAARQAIAAARDLRAAERVKARQAEEAAQAAEIAARAEAERLRRVQEADELLALEAERKAARDARYAARKARKV